MSAQYFCPRCQAPDVVVQRALVACPGNDGSARCPVCGWAGVPDDVLAALAPQGEVFWTAERVAEVLLQCGGACAARPLIRTLQQIGLAPRLDGAAEQQADAGQVLDAMMKDILEALVTAAFQAAEKHAAPHFRRFAEPARAELVERTFSYVGQA